MRFSFCTQWCTCGKPMALGCENPIPSDYFDQMTPYEAYMCHVLKMNYECDIKIPHDVHIDGNKLSIQSEKYQLCAESNNMNNYDFEIRACDSIHMSCDEVNDSEILLLKQIVDENNNKSFNEFANKYKSNITDIMVYDGNNWLFRLFVTSDYIHLHVNGNIYDLSDGSFLGVSSWRGTFKFIPVKNITLNGKLYEF